MSKPFSLYIHWPFCLSLCPYCDFNSHIASTIDHSRWLESYKTELEHYKEHIRGRKIQTIFFGGGTPSLMDPRTVEGILKHASKICEIPDDCEITLEANPTSYEADKFRDFKNAGINRVSLGVQSLRDERLHSLGRKHSAGEAISAIESAREIFDRYSFDLIYALPDQTLRDWEQELLEARNYIKDHISLYQLTIEKGTPFYKEHKDGRLILPENEIAASMYRQTRDILGELGLQAYEISNYSKLGGECRHNLAYWHYDEYVGIGPGAHSRIHKNKGADGGSVEAIMTFHSPDKWLSIIGQNGNGIQQRNSLTKAEIIEEIMMMGLRLREGIEIGFIERLSGLQFDDIVEKQNLDIYTQNGYIKIDGGVIKLTERGVLMHSYIVPRIIAL